MKNRKLKKIIHKIKHTFYYFFIIISFLPLFIGTFFIALPYYTFTGKSSIKKLFSFYDYILKNNK